MTANRLCLLVAGWIVLTAMGAFWQLFVKHQGGFWQVWVFAVSLALALTGLNLFLLMRGGFLALLLPHKTVATFGA